MLLLLVEHGARQAEVLAQARALANVPSAWLLTTAAGAVGLWLLLDQRHRGSDGRRLLGTVLALVALYSTTEHLGVTSFGLPW